MITLENLLNMYVDDTKKQRDTPIEFDKITIVSAFRLSWKYEIVVPTLEHFHDTYTLKVQPVQVLTLPSEIQDLICLANFFLRNSEWDNFITYLNDRGYNVQSVKRTRKVVA